MKNAAGLTTIFVTLAMPAAAAAAAPGDMNAQAFYTDAQAVYAKGMAAMFDKRTRPLMAQLEDAGKRTRAENQAATARGAPLYCVPPAERKKGMGPQQIIALIGSVPAADRQRMTLAEAWRSAIIARYPCH